MKGILLWIFSSLVWSCNAEDSVFFGDFIFFPTKELPNEYIFKRLNLQHECKCREICMSDPLCNGYDWKERYRDVRCRFSLSKIHISKLEPASLRTTFIKLDQFKFKGPKPEEYTYYTHFEAKSFDEALEVCNSVGGEFHLGVYLNMIEFKVLQNVFNDTGGEIWVNMERTTDRNDGKWLPNGPLYSSTELKNEIDIEANDKNTLNESMFRFNGTGFNDYDRTKPKIVLCQKN